VSGVEGKTRVLSSGVECGPEREMLLPSPLDTPPSTLYTRFFLIVPIELVKIPMISSNSLIRS
jgi:hypothetical protein